MTTTTYDLDRELDEMANRELDKDREAPRATSSASPARSARTSSASTALALPSAWNDRDLAVGLHLATLLAAVFSGGLADILVPAVAYAVVKDKSAFLKNHVRHQLNFQLTNLIVAIVMVVLSVVTLGLGLVVAVPVLVAFFLVDIVCSIKAATAASRGEDYRFPFSLELITEH